MILASLCNVGNDECLSLIDPFRVSFSSISVEWEGVVGATGITKTNEGYIIGIQKAIAPSSGLLILDNRLNQVRKIELEKVGDIHSLYWDGVKRKLYAVSTYDNAVYIIKIGKRVKETLYKKLHNDDRDMLHLNGITYHNGICVSMFGEREWGQHWNEIRDKGKIINIDTNEVMKENLCHPHTLKLFNRWIIYTESLNDTVDVGFCEFDLSGYIRGMCWDQDFFYVASSRPREVSRSTGEAVNSSPSAPMLFVIDRTKCEVRKSLFSPYDEIYDMERL